MDNSFTPGTFSLNSSTAGQTNGTLNTTGRYPGIDKYGWYDVNAYINNGGYSFIGNDYLPKVFPTTFNAKTYKLVNGKWVVTQ